MFIAATRLEIGLSRAGVMFLFHAHQTLRPLGLACFGGMLGLKTLGAPGLGGCKIYRIRVKATAT
jgi:hypothetical protein